MVLILKIILVTYLLDMDLVVEVSVMESVSTIMRERVFSNAGVVVTGILTATSFRGDGSQLTGVLAASEAGISVQDDQTAVGVSTTIDFGTGLSVSPVSAGVVTVTSGGFCKHKSCNSMNDILNNYKEI